MRHEGRRTILNCLGTALGGCCDGQIEHALAVPRPFSGPPEAALIGRAERLDTLTAAFINAAAANLHDFDDTHMQTIIHPSGPVVPGALAFAERLHTGGRQLLHAVILGLGATQACGLLDSRGHIAKSVSVGNAPRNGIVAALLAQRGFTAGPRTLDGKYGFVNKHTIFQSCRGWPPARP